MSPAAKALFGAWPTSSPGATATPPLVSPSSDATLALSGTTTEAEGGAAGKQAGEAARSASSLGVDETYRLEWTPLNILWAIATVLGLAGLAVGPHLRDRWRSR